MRTVGYSCSWPSLQLVENCSQPATLPVDCSDNLPIFLLTVQTASHFTCWQLRQPAVLPVDSSDSLLFCLLTVETACFACWQLRQPAVLPVDSWDNLFCLLTVETACCFACWQWRQPAVLPVDSWDSLLFCLLTVETACCFACWQWGPMPAVFLLCTVCFVACGFLWLPDFFDCFGFSAPPSPFRLNPNSRGKMRKAGLY